MLTWHHISVTKKKKSKLWCSKHEFPVWILSHLIFLVKRGTQVWKTSQVNPSPHPNTTLAFWHKVCPTSLGQPGCNPAIPLDRQSRPGQGCPKPGALPGKLTGREGRGVRRAGDGAACSGSGHCGGSAGGHAALGWADGQLAAARASIMRSSFPPPGFQRWCSLGLCRVCAGGSKGSLREQVGLCLLSYIRLHQSPLIYVNTLSTPRVLGLPDAMPPREAMGDCGTYLWRKNSPCCGEEGDWTRTRNSPYNILVEPGNAVVKQKKPSFSLAQKQ